MVPQGDTLRTVGACCLSKSGKSLRPRSCLKVAPRRYLKLRDAKGNIELMAKIPCERNLLCRFRTKTMVDGMRCQREADLRTQHRQNMQKRHRIRTAGDSHQDGHPSLDELFFSKGPLHMPNQRGWMTLARAHANSNSLQKTT
jgi:hypothetical protein